VPRETVGQQNHNQPAGTASNQPQPNRHLHEASLLYRTLGSTESLLCCGRLTLVTLLPCTAALPLAQADVVTVSTLIACCERLGDWQRAQAVWEWMTAQVSGQFLLVVSPGLVLTLQPRTRPATLLLVVSLRLKKRCPLRVPQRPIC
jgi:hypothetical protein